MSTLLCCGQILGMKNTHFCPKGPFICKISQQIILKWRNSKQEKFSNYLISKVSYGSLKSYGYLINSFRFIQIHSSFLPKGPFLSLVIYYSHIITWKWLSFAIGKNKTFCENLENLGSLGLKCTFSSSWDLMTTKYY